jgi:hypothetical protein
MIEFVNHLEVFRTIVRQGKTPTEAQLENVYQEVKQDFDATIVYSPVLLNRFIKEKLKISDQDIGSCISRCIERNLPESLQILLNWDQVASYTGPKNLYLRMITNVNCYLLARKHGWFDHEWEKRINFVQKIWKRKHYKSKADVPKLEPYNGPFMSQYEKSGQYYGYRRAMYFIRWNRKNRYKFYQELMRLGKWGTCSWQAYADFLKEDEQELPNIKNRAQDTADSENDDQDFE